MSLIKQIIFLIQKEVILEWRQKYAINGILLYVVATVVVVYFAFVQIQIEPLVWTTVFWIILLFASVNAVAKSFLQENVNRQRYYYTLTSPEAVILSKIIYNTGLLLLLATIALGVYQLLLNGEVANWQLYIGTILLGTVSFSLCFTLISGIAAKASNNATLMPILSFPVVIPLLSLLINVSRVAVLGVESENLDNDLGILVAIDGIMIVLSYILFPYLWRD